VTFPFEPQTPNDQLFSLFFLQLCLITFYTKRPKANLILATDCIVSFITVIKSKDPKYERVWDRDVLLSAARCCLWWSLKFLRTLASLGTKLHAIGRTKYFLISPSSWLHNIMLDQHFKDFT